MRVSRRTVELQTRNVVFGLAVPVLTVAAAAISGLLGLWVVRSVSPDARRLLDDLPVGHHRGAGDLVNGHLFMWGFVALAAAVVAAGLELARRRIGSPLLLSTSVVAWTFALTVTTVVHPPTAAAFAGPLIAASGSALLWTYRGPDRDVGAGMATLLALLGAPVVMLGASMTWMGYLGTTLTGVALLCAGSAVALGQLVPQLDVVGRANRWLPTALLASVATLLLATAALTRSTDADLLRFIEAGSVVWG